MKLFLRKLLSPILNVFESGEPESYSNSSRRTILIVAGVLFTLLSFVSLAAAFYMTQLGTLLPFFVFFITGFICLVIGALGTDAAVTKIWGNK